MSDEILQDPPSPDLDEVQQREHYAVQAVPVCVEGVTAVVLAPARSGSVLLEHLTTDLVRVLHTDPKRAAATFIGADAWTMGNKAGGTQCPIPADVPVRVQHCAEVWAAAATGTTTLTIITEVWAQ